MAATNLLAFLFVLTTFGQSMSSAVNRRLQTTTISDDKNFCWKDSYGRGVGKIPSGCPSGKVNEAGLCYTPCKASYVSDGALMCYSGCPQGYSSSGCCTCHINKPLTKDVDWRCTAWFPNWLGGACRWKDSYCADPHYTNAGLFCALTSAGKSAPAGFSGSFLDPMKNSYGRSPGTIPTGCGNRQYDAGLCYDKCKTGYTGLGPVCWGQPPSNWVQCGMGAARSDLTCASTVFDQVSSVGMMAFSIATLGGGSAANAADASKVSKLTQDFNKMKDAVKASPTIQKGIAAWKATEPARDLYKAGKAIDFSSQVYTPEDMVRLGGLVASLVDPTGISGVVAAYSYSKCSTLVALGK